MAQHLALTLVCVFYSLFLFIDPPEFVIISSDTFNCTPTGDNISCASYLGASGTLFCGADGNPTPVVTRSMSGVTSTSNIDASTRNDIHITSVVIGNAGTYVCAAVSSVFNTSVSRTFQLFVGGMYLMSTVAQPNIRAPAHKHPRKEGFVHMRVL